MTIDGREVRSAASMPVVNPATGTPFTQVPDCSRDELDRAVDAAARAFPSWRKDVEARRTALGACAAAIGSHLDELARLLTMEVGAPLRQTTAEVTAAGFWLMHAAELEWKHDLIQDDDKQRIEVHRRPVGVVGAITAWNGPLLLASLKLGPALLAGNTIVLKPSPLAPVATLRLGELLREALPPGVLNIVSGGDALGAALTEHPGVRKISFTGSVETGKKIAAVASRDLKRVTLELGGNDAAIVLGDVAPKAVAKRLFWGTFTNCGQVCVAIKRLYVDEKIYGPLVDELVTLAGSVVVGDGLDEATQMGPLQNKAQFQRVSGLVDEARAAGAKIVTGGKPLDRPGYFYPPTIVTGIAEGTRLVDEEQFGPVLPVMPYKTLDEAVSRANATSYGLGGSVWTNDLARGAEIAGQLDCGTAWVNQHLQLTPVAPFGGRKSSGVGYENGPWGLDEFCEAQTVSLRKR
jgi:acyl-CoA reductase-like NAD-dependent aldehyde dehydrogenase